jgi:hypothetical protein
MVDTATAVGPESMDGGAEPLIDRHDPLLARVPFPSALRLCGLFLGMWIVGNWFADLQDSLRGLHTACEVVAGCGCFLFVASSYIAVRSWQLRHPR